MAFIPPFFIFRMLGHSFECRLVAQLARCTALASGLLAGVPAAAADLDFFKDIQPFLQPNCIPCHNKTTTKAKLNLETPELIKKGGESGPAVISGKPAESLLLQSASHQGDAVMPPKDNKSGAVDLSPKQLALLREWIEQGAKASVKRTENITIHALPPGARPIYSVAITPDGRYAACGRGGQLFLYDLGSRQLLAQLKDPKLKLDAAHEEQVHALHFSPDGNRLASGGFQEVKIWRRQQSSAEIQTIGALSTTSQSTLSPDGKRVLAVDPNAGLIVCDASGRTVLQTFRDSPKANVKSLQFSPAGNTVACLLADGSWTLWSLGDMQKRSETGILIGARSLAWSPDGNNLLFCANSSVTVWSLAEAKVLREINVPEPLACAMSTDHKSLVVACADSALRLFDFQSGKPGLQLRGDARGEYKLAKLEWEMARAGLDAAHHASLIARIDLQNKAFDVQEKKATEAIAAAKKELPEKLKAVAPAQKVREDAEKADDIAAAELAAVSEGISKAAALAKRKDTSTKLATAITAATSAATAVISAENHIKDGDEQLKTIADARTGNALNRSKAEGDQEAAKKVQSSTQASLEALKNAKPSTEIRPLAVAFSNNNLSVAVAYSDGRQYVWSAISGASLGSLSFGSSLTSASVVSPANADFITLGSGGRIAKTAPPDQWKLEHALGGAIPSSTFVDRVCAVRFSPNARMLATGGGEPTRSGDVHLWDPDSGKLLQTWKDKHSDTVLALDFSPDGTRLASGGADRLGRITDVTSGRPIYSLEAHTQHVMGVAFRDDGRMLATAGADGLVNTWDMSSGERAKKITGWSKEVTGIQYLGATSKLVTSSADNQVRIVTDEGAEVRSLAKLPDFMQAAASATHAAHIVGGGEDSALRLWDSSTGAELVLFGAPQKTP